VGTNWVPSLLTTAGFGVGVASYGLTAFNFGGVVGAILGAILIGRLGSRTTMLAMSAGAIAGAALLASVSIGVQSAFAILAMLAWTGGLINAVQTTMYALAAHVYPTGIRATGIGTAVAVGRIGGVVSPYAGAWALDRGGPSLMFLFIAGGAGGRTVGKAGVLALIYFEIVTTLALMIGLIVVNVARPGGGMNVDPASLDAQAVAQYVTAGRAQSVTGFLLDIIPTSVVDAFARGDILQVLLISVL